MIFGGLQKNSLIDFPGAPAAVAFAQGCGWACPYCHNSMLIPDRCESPISAEDVIQFACQRPPRARNLVVSGGEPTRQPDLPEFLRVARQHSLHLKLDTNGSNPHMLQQVLDHGLVDYVAMDVKGPLPDYRRYSGKRECAPTVKESIHILKSSRIPYEFRTTVVPNLHKTTDIARLAQSLEGGRVLYLQPFRAQHALAQSLRNSPEPTPATLQEFCNVAERFIPVKIRS